VLGAVLGALFIVFVPEYASDINDAAPGVIYGAVLILFMIFLPHGAMGLARRIGGGFGSRGRKQQAAEPDAATQSAVPAAGR